MFCKQKSVYICPVFAIKQHTKNKTMKTQVELQIEWNLRRRIKRLELQANLQKDLGNLGRADILFMKIKKLKNKLK